MNLKKKGFQLPEKIRFDEETLTDTYGKIVVEPLERGFGVTLGNALRRVLLSSLEGTAITSVKVAGALHEFSSINGVKEDTIDIILNMKKLRFRSHGDTSKTALFNVKGPALVTGADLQCDSTIEILNPDQAIATLDKNTDFNAEVYIKKGKGYLSSEYNKKEDLPVGMIAVDAAFSPIRKVKFDVEKTRVKEATDYDRLILEIWTDGSVTPQRALSDAASIMIDHMDIFVADEEFETVQIEAAEAGDGPSISGSNPNLNKTV
ncbi:MAG: DNA-directed RNA polymerase subunit alpha, partial [Nitrospirota bacterium]|nr:DNA-directed RNA polymerase subunit alpha [Nitrospirota bacterium]